LGRETSANFFERLSYYAAFASLARYLNETLHFPGQGVVGALTGLFGRIGFGSWPSLAEP